LAKRLAASRKGGQEHRIDGLLSERDKLMDEIALRARLGSLPPMLVKARTLLTRFWGKAGWDARSEILPVARMLLTLGAAQPALRAPQGLPQEQRVRSPKASRGRKAMQPSRKVVEIT
jgi:hypothetical protein